MNGLAPKRCHTITWINDGQIPQCLWCHWMKISYITSEYKWIFFKHPCWINFLTIQSSFIDGCPCKSMPEFVDIYVHNPKCQCLLIVAIMSLAGSMPRLLLVFIHRKISNTSHTKSPNLNISHFVLQSHWPNPLKPDVRSRMKMLLERCRQAMLQLHLSDATILLPKVSYIRGMTVHENILANSTNYTSMIKSSSW